MEYVCRAGSALTMPDDGKGLGVVLLSLPDFQVCPVFLRFFVSDVIITFLGVMVKMEDFSETLDANGKNGGFYLPHFIK